jgi:molybdopterin molybdotransferase
LPLLDNSAMDGYAVVANACAAGARLKVIGEQPAGVDRRLTVATGEAVRIFTGAPLPTGADAVVMQEDVTLSDDEIILESSVQAGEFVRRRGGDIAEGQRMLAKGERITPQMIALLAAQGIGSLEVGGEVRAALISTGDELVAAGVELHAGQIYDANSALLRALLTRCGVKVESVSHCADRADEIETAVRAGAVSDVMIVTGGVSVGARDFVKEAITTAGGTLVLWRVAVKPGKPFLFGRAGTCAIFGLPGNPVSAFVTFLVFVRPALLKLMGANDAALRLPARQAQLESEVSNDGERPHYVRGVLNGGAFRPIGRQESHALFGLSRADALLLVPPRETLAAGTQTTVFTWE